MCSAPCAMDLDPGQKPNRWVVRDSYAGMFRLFVCANISRPDYSLPPPETWHYFIKHLKPQIPSFVCEITKYVLWNFKCLPKNKSYESLEVHCVVSFEKYLSFFKQFVLIQFAQAFEKIAIFLHFSG